MSRPSVVQTQSRVTEPNETERLSPSSEERTARSVRRLIEEGFNRGDLSILDEVLDPTYIEHQPLAPGVPPTTEAVRATIHMLRTGFPDFHLSIEQLDCVQDRVWLRMRGTGTNRGPFMGHPATGRTLSIDVMDVVRVKDGRIAEQWGVPDHMSAMEQLGMLGEEGDSSGPQGK
jgi:predicted ester cyclase